MAFGPVPPSRRRSPGLEEPGEGLGVHLVRVEPPQFLFQQFGGFPAVQGDPALGLPGAAQVGDAPVRPGITEVSFTTDDGEIVITRPDGRVAHLRRPGQPERRVALHRRETPEPVSYTHLTLPTKA